MTVKELYESINGNYESALKTLMTDSLIEKFIAKIPDDPSCPELLKAAETMDSKLLFESSHAMKGVYANLGLEKLSQAASIITEEFRPGHERSMSDEAVKEKIEEIRTMYESTVAAIQSYLQPNA